MGLNSDKTSNIFLYQFEWNTDKTLIMLGTVNTNEHWQDQRS